MKCHHVTSFLYLPKRGTIEAPNRVQSHCDFTRTGTCKSIGTLSQERTSYKVPNVKILLSLLRPFKMHWKFLSAHLHYWCTEQLRLSSCHGELVEVIFGTWRCWIGALSTSYQLTMAMDSQVLVLNSSPNL